MTAPNPQINHTQPPLKADHGHIPGTAILKVTNLTVRYESGTALEQISFELNTGERMAVVGPNGAGKSTLFKIIAGVMKSEGSSVKVFGAEPRGHICIAYLPQRSQVDWNFPVSVSDVVMMGRTRRVGYLRWPSNADREIVKNALETVGMQDLAARQINQLSGGQQQRMFIARALAQEAELMLMDEPFTGLDAPSQDELFSVLDTLRSRKVTVMVALHDLKLAAERFDRVMLLNHRLVGLGTPAEVFREETLNQAYGDHIQVLVHEQQVSIIDDTCCGEDGHSHA
ncbi:MAG: metal ABC transporter ATP-binding protein [Anaerolineaceae bacterium]|nr:metal ABC transporter ATP-binding protein [Anaerolineaceae bacterium]